MAPRFLIGLTGNIATGKSEVTKTLRELGAIVLDADQVARDVVEPGRPALADIARVFGPDVLNADGSLNRKALGDIVFGDRARLRSLEAITHPAIRGELLKRIVSAPAGSVVVVEAIRLIEGGWADRCDSVWVTHCPEDMQIERLMHSRGLTAAEAHARVRAQSPQADKLARADVIIDTSGPKEHSREQVREAWARLVPPA